MASFLDRLNDPEVQRGLMQAGLAMMAASAPSTDPRSGSLAYILGRGGTAGLQAADRYKRNQLRNKLLELKEQDLMAAQDEQARKEKVRQAIKEVPLTRPETTVTAGTPQLRAPSHSPQAALMEAVRNYNPNAPLVGTETREVPRPTEDVMRDYGRVYGKYGQLENALKAFKAAQEEPESKSYDMKTVYGPNGQTRRVSIVKGSNYTPPEGWSLDKPESTTGGGLKIGATKERLLDKRARGEEWTEAEQEAWDMLSKEDKLLGDAVLRMLANDFRFQHADAETRAQMIRDAEKTAREIYGLEGGGGGAEHPLAGRPPGRYEVNGREIKWDGEKEIP
jgi:hypothetical protein